MGDIVERLRAPLMPRYGVEREAADTIEALRAENAQLEKERDTFHRTYREVCDEEVKIYVVEMERLRAENAKLKRRIDLFKNTRNEKVFEKLMKAHGEIEKLREALKAQVIQWEAARAAMGESDEN